MNSRKITPHESAHKHVTGEAVYVNDMLMSEKTLIGKVVYSKHAHAKIKSIDFSEALKLKGVKTIISHKDIPGHNNMGPVVHDEPCLADNIVSFIGQAILLIAADKIETCIEAEKLIKIEYELLETILDIETSIAKNNIIAPPRKIERGNITETIKKAEYSFKNSIKIGGQEHWYLETQSSYCINGEDGEMIIYTSSQNPTETQIIIAEVLGLPSNKVIVDVKRMGGGFGGKETQANHVAAWASLLSYKTNSPVKMVLSRDEDQKITGKRHRFLINYEIAYDKTGKILAYDVDLNSDAGSSTDLSIAILERAMLHAENSYFIPNIRIIGKAWKTNLPSNTAYRGFGGPQGMAAIENAIDEIARKLKKDPDEIRKINFYQELNTNSTPYNQILDDVRLQLIHKQLLDKSNYNQKRIEIAEFNKNNQYKKRGIALTPVKFGISFTTSFLNQAGALVNIYRDGTIIVNHGGVEMGQGLYTKILQIASAELGVSYNNIRVAGTNTSKVPNTSATAASSGTDLNGMAVKNAIDKLKLRLAEIAVTMINDKYLFSADINDIYFHNDLVYDIACPEKSIPFTELINKAYLNQISLSATGFYKTPDIYFNKEKGEGKPFHYFAYGMSCSVVEIDLLTGGHSILSTNIIHDCGDSLNIEIDKGQIEGAFVQGVGWCTSEELKYDKLGNLLNHSPDTYKIPSIKDIPIDFNVELLANVPNKDTIRNSKAVGEPPFMHCFSVWLAIKDALLSINNYENEINWSLPATNELIIKLAHKEMHKL